MTDFTDDEQRQTHWFKPGQSGNPKGRPKGSRNKLVVSGTANMKTVYQALTLRKWSFITAPHRMLTNIM